MSQDSNSNGSQRARSGGLGLGLATFRPPTSLSRGSSRFPAALAGKSESPPGQARRGLNFPFRACLADGSFRPLGQAQWGGAKDVGRLKRLRGRPQCIIGCSDIVNTFSPSAVINSHIVPVAHPVPVRSVAICVAATPEHTALETHTAGHWGDTPQTPRVLSQKVHLNCEPRNTS